MKRKLVAILAMLVLALTPIALAGCDNSAATMSFYDYQTLEISAAQSFKNEHTEYDTFRDVTYHWTESSTAKENINLYYNKVSEGDDYTYGVFENKTVENRECWLAVKKTDGSLVAKLTVNTNKVETNNAQDVSNNNQHGEFVTTTVTQEVFYITTATKETDTLNVVSHYKSIKVNDADAVVTKKYEEVTDIAGLTPLIKSYALSYANTSVARNFFSYAELLLYPGYNTNLTKTGNQVKYSFGYNIAEIKTNLNWEKVEVAGIVLYENNKVVKAEISNKQTTENTSEILNYSLTLTNSATTEALDLDGYTETEGIIELYRNSSQSIIH